MMKTNAKIMGGLTVVVLLLAGVSLVGASLVLAESGERKQRNPEKNFPQAATAILQSWNSECGECHLAFPAAMLPARSWQTIMTTLDKHFGVDASLEPAIAEQIATYLKQNAGAAARFPNDAGTRITLAPWFVRKHDEVSAQTWQLVKVKSKANCIACHSGADKGNYDEDEVRIPR